MGKRFKEAVINAPRIAYFSGFGGVEIKDIKHLSVIFVANAWYGEKSVHSAKIYCAKRPYFLCKGKRIHLDECVVRRG